MLYEIRNYYYDPSKYEEYKVWAREEAIPFLKANLDIVGMWAPSGDPPEFMGVDPTPSQHGTPNVTWIIRWESMGHRKQAQEGVFGRREWREIWSRHPDANGYLHMQVTFAEEV